MVNKKILQFFRAISVNNLVCFLVFLVWFDLARRLSFLSQSNVAIEHKICFSNFGASIEFTIFFSSISNFYSFEFVDNLRLKNTKFQVDQLKDWLVERAVTILISHTSCNWCLINSPSFRFRHFRTIAMEQCRQLIIWNDLIFVLLKKMRKKQWHPSLWLPFHLVFVLLYVCRWGEIKRNNGTTLTIDCLFCRCHFIFWANENAESNTNSIH